MRSFLILVCFFVSSLLVLPILALASFIWPRALNIIAPLFYRFICRLVGIEITVKGEKIHQGPTLFVTNHASWLDILILGSRLKASFIAKSEVGTWPFFGWMAKASRTVFLKRNQRSKTLDQRKILHDRIYAGDSLVLFPEGTSSDGNRILPFKSALFSVAQHPIWDGAKEHSVTVQPISIRYTKLNGLPLGRQFMPNFAWYGDMGLFPHLWRALSLGHICVELHIHSPVNHESFENRKALALDCRQRICETFYQNQ
jgi:1-acyl-sn-glycerol-3-phosphate acyltransferase